MARKAKAVAPSVVADLIANEVENIEVLVPEVETEEEVVEQSTGPSLVSLMVPQMTDTVTTPEVAKTEKNVGVGVFIKGLITEGLGNKEILAIVHEQYGNSQTTYACVAWYRNKMKKTSEVVVKNNNLDWLQNFAKVNGLSEEAVVELTLKVA